MFPLLQTLARYQINQHLIPVIANSSKRMTAHMVCFSYVHITVFPYHLLYSFHVPLSTAYYVSCAQHICLCHMYIM